MREGTSDVSEDLEKLCIVPVYPLGTLTPPRRDRSPERQQSSAPSSWSSSPVSSGAGWNGALRCLALGRRQFLLSERYRGRRIARAWSAVSIIGGVVDDVAFDAGPGLAETSHRDAVVGDQLVGGGVEVQDRARERLGFLTAEGSQSGATGRSLDQQASRPIESSRALWVCPASTSGTSPPIVSARRGVVDQHDVDVRGSSAASSSATLGAAASAWSRSASWPVGWSLFGVYRVSATPQNAQTRDRGGVTVEHDGVRLRRDGALRGGRVVVAAHPHVWHADVLDSAHQPGLWLGSPVGDVTGVGDSVDAELLDEELDQIERLRVVVDVAHMQHPDRPSSGSKVGSPCAARYRVTTFPTSSVSCARYSPNRSTTPSTSPTAVGATVNSPEYSGSPTASVSNVGRRNRRVPSPALRTVRRPPTNEGAQSGGRRRRRRRCRRWLRRQTPHGDQQERRPGVGGDVVLERFEHARILAIRSASSRRSSSTRSSSRAARRACRARSIPAAPVARPLYPPSDGRADTVVSNGPIRAWTSPATNSATAAPASPNARSRNRAAIWRRRLATTSTTPSSRPWPPPVVHRVRAGLATSSIGCVPGLRRDQACCHQPVEGHQSRSCLCGCASRAGTRWRPRRSR